MGQEQHRVRVLLAKPGMDGHDRGIRLVARALRDAGVETVFLGIQVTADELVEAAIQESIDVIGLSIFCRGHMTLIPRMMDKLLDNGLGDIPVVVGGIIPPADAVELEWIGVKEVFGPGCFTSEIVSAFSRWARAPQ